MNKLTCGIIRDLLPLYVDNVCSEDSKAIVKEHIAACPMCEAELMNLQSAPDVKAEIGTDINNAVKNAGKIIKKSKKKAVAKTLSITTSVLLVAGLLAYLILPIKSAYHSYCNDGYLYALCGLIDIEISNKQPTNYQGRYADIYIPEALGKYTATETETGNKIVFEDGKELYISYTPTDKSNGKSFYEENGLFGISGGGYRFPYFNPIIKKGVEYMGVNPDEMYTDATLYTKLLHARTEESWTNHKVPLKPKEFIMWYTYFALFTDIMPYSSPGINYYIYAENDTVQGWGWSGFHEDFGNRYIISLQPKDDIYSNYALLFMGFEREDMLEITESVVLK